MKSQHWLTGLSLLTALSLSTLQAHAIDLGQIDTFEDGTTQGWSVGSPHPLPPVNIATGGPAGVDDNYLELYARGGAGPGSRFAAFNLAQWGGDYTAAGVTTIRMDVNNLSASDISLRLLFADPMFGPPTNVAISADAILVPASSGWTSIDFMVDTASLTALAGDVNTALSSATELRLFHALLPEFPGPAVVARLGVDNITAAGVAAVPEPSALLAFSTGTLLLLAARRRRSLRRG